MKNLLIVIAILFFLPNILHAQLYNVWTQIYGTSNNQNAFPNLLRIDNNNKIYLIANNSASTIQNGHLSIYKTDNDGLLVWQKEYTHLNKSVALDAVISDGNLIIVGYLEHQNPNNRYKLYIQSVKLFDGEQNWVNVIDSVSDFTFNYYEKILLHSKITLDANGNFYVTFSNYGPGGKIIKIDNEGNLKWVLETKDIKFSDLKFMNDKLFLVGIKGSGGSIIYCSKIDTNKTILLESEYRFSSLYSNNIPYSICIDSNENYYIGGFLDTIIPPSSFSKKRLILKYDKFGNLIWNKILEEDLNSFGFVTDMKIFNNSLIVSSNIVKTTNLYNLLMLDFNGKILWERIDSSSTSSLDFPRKLIVNNESIFIKGSSIFKYDLNGIKKWHFNQFFINNFEIDNSNSIIVSSTIYNQPTYNIQVSKFTDTTVNIFSLSGKIIDHYSLHQNYPNPFNPVTNIKFSIPKSSFVNLKVFDITGREVATLVNKNLNAGEYNYQFSPIMSGQAMVSYQLSSGVYFYQLRAMDNSTGNKFVQSRKMILTK